MKKILVTGFDPFNKEDMNSSYEVVKLLPDKMDLTQIIKLELPNEYNQSINKLYSNLDKVKPDAVICLGQAGGRPNISLERIGINIRDCRLPDNKGKIAKEEFIFSDGQDGYFSNLPLKDIKESLLNQSIPVSVSNDAGAFVCNNVLYSLMYYIRQRKKHMLGGFIHLPYIRNQVVDKANNPYIELDSLVKAVEIIIKTTIESL